MRGGCALWSIVHLEEMYVLKLIDQFKTLERILVFFPEGKSLYKALNVLGEG